MRSETCPYAPEPGTFCMPVPPGRAWPGPYMVWRNHSGVADMSGLVLAEHMNVFAEAKTPAVARSHVAKKLVRIIYSLLAHSSTFSDQLAA